VLLIIVIAILVVLAPDFRRMWAHGVPGNGG